MELSEKESSFRDRLIRRKKLFLLFSVLSTAVGVLLLLYHALIARDLGALRFLVVILLLLAGRAHLRQYKSAEIFEKLAAQEQINEQINESIHKSIGKSNEEST